MTENEYVYIVKFQDMNREIIATYIKAWMVNGFRWSEIKHIYHNSHSEQRIIIDDVDMNFIETITSHDFTKALTKWFIISRALDNEEFDYYHHRIIQEQAVAIAQNKFDDWYKNYFDLDFNI